MSILVPEVTITLHGHTYIADVTLGLYHENHQPAILLLTSADDPDMYAGELLTKATTNVDRAYLTGMPENCIVAKTWSENEGLWGQLLPLKGPDNLPLFRPLGKAVMLSPYVHGEVIQLVNHAVYALKTLRGELGAH